MAHELHFQAKIFPYGGGRFTPECCFHISSWLALEKRISFAGSIGAAQNLEGLRDAGITHILNASPLVPCFFKNYFQYLQINAHDDAEEDITQYFAHTNDFIEQVVSKCS